jgi:predicted transcriptional regulator
MFVFQGAFSGAWLAFLGWFLLSAAAGEARYATARQALSGIRVRDLMVPDPVSVPPDLPLGRFMDEIVWRRRYTTYPVVDAGRAVGLLPFRCVAEVPRAEWDSRRVQDCMLPLEKVPLLDPDTEAIDALAELQESEVGRGLVLDGDRLAGLLSMTDLARAFEAAPRRRQPPAPTPARP